DWSSDVCSSDLARLGQGDRRLLVRLGELTTHFCNRLREDLVMPLTSRVTRHHRAPDGRGQALPVRGQGHILRADRRLLDGLKDEGLACRGGDPKCDRAPE